MQITTRRVGQFLDVKVEVGSATLDLGFQNAEEVDELIGELSEALDELKVRRDNMERSKTL